MGIPIQWSLTFGVGGNSPLAGREDDKFGIGWYHVGISDEFGLGQLIDPIDDGQGVEFFYDIAISEAFRLAFDLQFVDPTLSRADMAVVPGMRGRIEF
jgi:porin